MTAYLVMYAVLGLVGLAALGPAVAVAVVILVKLAQPGKRQDGFQLLRASLKGAVVVGLVGGAVLTGACALLGGRALEQAVVIFVGAALSGFGWAGAWDLFIPA